MWHSIPVSPVQWFLSAHMLFWTLCCVLSNLTFLDSAVRLRSRVHQHGRELRVGRCLDICRPRGSARRLDDRQVSQQSLHCFQLLDRRRRFRQSIVWDFISRARHVVSIRSNRKFK